MVNIGVLLTKAGLTESASQAHRAIHAGKVAINNWTIGHGQYELPRWVLRGVTLSVDDRSVQISDDGGWIVRGLVQEAL